MSGDPLLEPVDQNVANRAAAAARDLAAANPLVQVALSVLSSSRQIYMRVIDMLECSLKESNIADAAVVLETLQASAMNRAESKPLTLLELQQTLLNHMVPFIDALIKREEAYKQEEKKDEAAGQDAAADVGSPEPPG